MTTSVADHYANHLAPIYSWMVGDFEAACKQADNFYADLGLADGDGRIAADLGCGHGVHAVPLARRGYHVFAFDTSAYLLSELKAVVNNLPIKTVAADLTRFTDHLETERVSLVVCMGDTLTHLSSINDVNALIRDVALKLVPDGLIIFSFRDYSTHELTGTDRFIPVRSDDHRIHTCFLEYRPDSVIVHDIVHSLIDSSWQTSVSAYPKLRLPPDSVIATAESHGLSLIHRTAIRGMVYLAFKLSANAIAG